MTERESILLVDDEQMILDAVRRNHRKTYDVRVARDAEEGLQILDREGPFAVVVSDYQMPGTNGISFLARVRNISPDSARILLTGNADLKIAIDAVNQGHILRFLMKPCAAEVLAAALSVGARHYHQRLEDVNRAERAKNSFLTTVSHELQTPITGIRASAEILLACEGIEKDIHDEFLSTILVESDRLSRLIRQILDVSNIASGEVSLSISDLDLGEEIRAIVAGLSDVQHVTDIDIALDLPDRSVAYSGDRERLRQALTNVLGNALKISPRSSRVTVSLQASDEGYEIRVADRGPGVADDMKASIFESFVQTKDILTNKPQGAGLGLALAEDIIEMHGGLICCEDNPSGGAVFVITLPVPAPVPEPPSRVSCPE